MLLGIMNIRDFEINNFLITTLKNKKNCFCLWFGKITILVIILKCIYFGFEKYKNRFIFWLLI